MSTHCNLESQITWTCESGPLTEELRRHLKIGLENLTLAFLSGPEAQWQAGRCLGRYALTPTVTQLLFEVWEDSLPRPRREETAVEQPADADVRTCTVHSASVQCTVYSAPLGNFSSDAPTLAGPVKLADSEA